MAEKKPRLRVTVADEAAADLDNIWRWNVGRYGIERADRYAAYLRKAVHDLGESFARGQPVPAAPSFHFQLVRRRSSDHGHVLVYHILDTSVRVIHVFHSAQDWQSYVADN